MPQQVRRWLRIALWTVPLLGLGAGLCWLPIWPASGPQSGFEALCSAAAALVRVAQSAVAAPAAPVPAAAPAAPKPAAPPPVAAIQTVPGMPPVLDPANLYSAAGANMLSPAVAGDLSRVYVPNLRSDDVYVIDPATRKVVDRFPVGVIPQHVVPSWDLQTLWVANNGRRRSRRQRHPDRPEDRQARPQHSGGRSLQHVFHPGRKCGDRRRRAAEAARFPRSAYDEARAVPADAGLLRDQPRRFLDRRALCDLHLRVPRRRPGQDRHGQPQGARAI